MKILIQLLVFIIFLSLQSLSAQKPIMRHIRLANPSAFWVDGKYGFTHSQYGYIGNEI